MTTAENLAKSAKVHAMAKAVIADKLRVIFYPHPMPQAESVANAILAELAAHDPPLLVCTPDEMKE
jgi:hypothetical protein